MQRHRYLAIIFISLLLLLLSSCSKKTTEPDITPPNFVFVKGGMFDNGSSDVTVSSFYLAKNELTQGEYHAVMGVNPAFEYGVGTNYPVYYVTWFNAIEYCNRRSMQEGFTPCYSYREYGTDPDGWPEDWDVYRGNHVGVNCNWNTNGYRLPTEMEWMFAARGGRRTHDYTYSGGNDLDLVGWYEGNNDEFGTKPVGGKSPNELGLYDMSGNVWEMVWDMHGFYPEGAQNNPTGAMISNGRVSRGGSWVYEAEYCTISYRSFSYPTDNTWNLGFRVCRVFS